MLDAQRLRNGLSRLGRAADGRRQVLLQLTLQNEGIAEAPLLLNYPHLQVVLLDYNALQDLSCLAAMEHLVNVSASHNQITSCALPNARTLRSLNLSHNNLTDMEAVNTHRWLRLLNLAHNKLTRIQGLEPCTCLEELNLSHNAIEMVAGLHTLSMLHKLDLSCNRISTFGDGHPLSALRELNLAHNMLTDLAPLKDLMWLSRLDVSHNEISELRVIEALADLEHLRQLDLTGNPVQSQLNYRLNVLFALSRLRVLDGQEALPEEKVDAINLCHPPLEVLAAQEHALQLSQSVGQDVQVLASSCLVPQHSYPLLVLTGSDLTAADQIAAEVAHHQPAFERALLHHVSNSRPNRPDGHAVTLEEFESMRERGAFLHVCRIPEQSRTGLSVQELERIAAKGNIAVVVLDAVGALAMRLSGFGAALVWIRSQTDQQPDKCAAEFARLEAAGTFATTVVYNKVNVKDCAQQLASVCEDLRRAYKEAWDMSREDTAEITSTAIVV